MTRLIDADALAELLKREAEHHEADGLLERSYGVLDAYMDVLQAPTVHPEPPKRGQWVRHYIRPNVFKDLYWHCSECGHRETYSYANRYYKFCPCCGAYMGGENGND